MLKKSLAIASALSLLAASGAWAAPAAATYTLQITGFVPTVCRANLNDTQAPSQTGVVSLGQMNEFCNDGAGYQVWVDYTPSLAGDTLQVGDQSYLLDGSGSVMVDASGGPNIASKAVTLNETQSVSGSVSVRVVQL